MEFLDEDARPKFLFQSRTSPSPSESDPQSRHQSLNKPLIFVAVTLSTLLLLLSLFFVESEPFKSLVLWVSLSLLIGPFAPSNLTGGDIRVGQGPILEPPLVDEPEPSTKKPHLKKRPKPMAAYSTPIIENSNGSLSKDQKSRVSERSGHEDFEEDWTEEDFEMLKKQLLKNPVGKPRRWEVIAEAFNGRHKVETVIKKAKEMGERKLNNGDSYAQFLKNRKPMDVRIQEEVNEGGVMENVETKKSTEGVNAVVWAAGEDIALLNALKAFPKDVAMRWEKIAAAVPGKSKAACMKRVAELKKDFRSSKANAEG
ncbi:putative DNA binding protein [Tripterygium wilfordii]|uniref:Putative DNA binding protein n=1 Tax=Tripterygium wilfordii TaxID=458696 RepID=A0A7J7DY09_TRIWF|nr:transcription factor MAMYB [Tripterygium wilfordii]KAF5751141.1 putative DNA binding protein [Tripterygium wilfordii]